MAVRQASMRGREAVKHNTIVSRLRRQIATGRLKPGARLPIRPQLEDRFAASRMTVQRALDLLGRDGFTQSRGKLGTFVAPHPPCLTRFGLVFSHDPQHPRWTGYHAAVIRVAREIEAERSLQFPLFCNVAHDGSGAAYNELVREIEAERLAGLIFLEGPYALVRTPVMEHPHLPRVAVMTPLPTAPFDRLATVWFHREQLIEAGVAMLGGLGCRRVGALTLALDRERGGERFIATARSRGLQAESFWTQGVSLDARATAEHVAQLIMSLSPQHRPDGLFILDDNLVEHACRGLLAAGVRVGQDVQVVALANFPMVHVDVLPIHRIGFDARELLSLCLDVLTEQRQGSPAPVRRLLHAKSQQPTASNLLEKST